MLDVYVYHRSTQQVHVFSTLEDARSGMDDPDTWFWVDLVNPSEAERACLQQVFQFDALAIEDCIHPRQLPKLESFQDYHFFIVQSVALSVEHNVPQQAELDGFLADRYLVTYHEEEIPAVTQAKKQLQQAPSASRLCQGSAYLLYQILDGMIDQYLPVLDGLDDSIHKLSKRVERNDNTAKMAAQFSHLSRQILQLRRVALKNQQVFYQFSHSSMQFIDADEARLFRDIYDHMVRVVDLSEYYQQSIRDALNIQFSISAFRTNRVVQVLTVFASIMLPLNVLTGVYGMNFDHMPFLHDPNGFWAMVTFMILVSVGLLALLRKKGWI